MDTMNILDTVAIRREIFARALANSEHISPDQSIKILQLPSTIEMALYKRKVITIKELCSYRVGELLAFRHIGFKSLITISTALAQHGYHLQP